MSRPLAVSMLMGLLLLVFAAGTLTQSASTAQAEPLARTPVRATYTAIAATSIAATAVAQSASRSDTGSILLKVTGAPVTACTVVQWQDGLGDWHAVEGWRGDLDNGEKMWWVLKPNFGQGPFRWLIYDRRDGSVWETSQSFFLPKSGGVEVQVIVGTQ